MHIFGKKHLHTIEKKYIMKANLKNRGKGESKMENEIKIAYISDNWIGCRVTLDIPMTTKEWNTEEESKDQTITLKEHRLHMIEKMPNLYEFYAEQLHDTEDHRAGYLWTSNCEAMNEYYKMDLEDVYVKLQDSATPRCAGITVEALKKILPEGYIIVKSAKHYKVILEKFEKALRQEGFRRI